MSRYLTATCLAATALMIASASPLFALEPPTPEQLERYRLDGTLDSRVAAARAFGNHRMAPALVAGIADRKALPGDPNVLPSSGSPRVLALLISFQDMPGHTDPTLVDDRLYGDGEPSGYPYESMTSFYRRSSYGLLEIAGSTLGWYQTPYPRSQVVQSTSGRERLIREAITHFDTQGHDFSQYDNDGDGVVDYLIVVWTGEHGEWAEFWWGYQTSYQDETFVVDGIRLGTYSWQWESYDWPGEFTPEVVIHETGHALGLPDYYDYDDDIGPVGGVGGLDQMDGNWGDHNCFSKWVLGWLTPEIYNQDGHQLLLSPSDETAQAAVFMHGDPVTDPYAEYFMVQHRRRRGNDHRYPADGLLIWHVDARTDDNGRFLYDNSYTEHKLLRLMEADGLEQIEMGHRADEGDFYTPGDVFDATSAPSSNRYDGAPTNLAIDTIEYSDDDVSLQADLGSGCALWCDADVSAAAWPGLPITFAGALSADNCQSTPTLDWVFGDGASSTGAPASHAYVSAGTYTWALDAELGDASCGHQGMILVCTDLRCWQWQRAATMAWPHANHAAVEMTDGRILVVGGGVDGVVAPPEVFDPSSGQWTEATSPGASFESARGALLDDGRVLIVGSSIDQVGNTEIYDPTSGSWATTGQLNHDRQFHSAVKLADGRVLAAGGYFRAGDSYWPVAEVEVWDPVSGAWSVIGTLSGWHFLPGMTTIPDGRALIVSGREVTVFDPASDTLSRGALLPSEFSQPITVTLDDGRVLIGGGETSTRALIWDPVSSRWDLAGSLGAPRAFTTATKLVDGSIILAGGVDLSGSALTTIEIFDPATKTWSQGSSLDTARALHSATLLSGGQLVLVGGLTNDSSQYYGATNTVETLTRPVSPPRNAGGRAAR
jgi:M6 family metalloprotease-like protein